jgi:hypothetical protein
MIGTGCIGKCKFIYHIITAMSMMTALKFESTFNKMLHKKYSCIIIPDLYYFSPIVAYVGLSIFRTYIVKPVHVVILNKQSPVLKGHLFLVLS